MKIITAIIVCFSLLAFSCDDEKSFPAPGSEDKVDANIRKLSDANIAFGLAMLTGLSQSEPADENLLISPFSIQTAMSMALNGAAGNTAKQILESMYLDDLEVDELNTLQKAWREQLTDKSGHPVLLESNAYFKDPERILSKESFENNLQKFYSVYKEDFDFNDPQTKTEINKWVEKSTEGKIDEIIEGIEADDIAFLINAIYFRADWKNGFSEAMTSEQNFTLANGKSINVPLMSADRNFLFVKKPEYIAVDLPFKDSSFSLTLISTGSELPALQTLISDLSADFYKNLFEEMSYGRAMVLMPRMKLSYKNKLNELLIEMGMEDAFSRHQANFENIGKPLIGPRIFINKVVHKSVLEIDEKGAEGAAATSVGIGVTSLPPVLRFDRPFILCLRHVETNSLIFIGRVMNPAIN